MRGADLSLKTSASLITFKTDADATLSTETWKYYNGQPGAGGGAGGMGAGVGQGGSGGSAAQGGCSGSVTDTYWDDLLNGTPSTAAAGTPGPNGNTIDTTMPNAAFPSYTVTFRTPDGSTYRSDTYSLADSSMELPSYPVSGIQTFDGWEVVTPATAMGTTDSGLVGSALLPAGSVSTKNICGNVVLKANITNHKHNFTYEASGNVVKAYCTETRYAEECRFQQPNAVTLILTASNAVYTSGMSYTGATVENNITAVTGAAASEIQYSETPNHAGSFTASVTLGGQTAKANFGIEKAEQNATVSTAGYAYGTAVSTPAVSGVQESATVSYFYNSTDSNSGGTAWNDLTATTLLPGSYYVYAELAATDNYKPFTTPAAAFTVTAQSFTGITATGYSGIYDGAAHSITVSGAPEGATVTYKTGDGAYSTENPSFVNAGSYTVSYKVSMTGYNDFTGSAEVKIAKKPLDDSMISTIAPQTYSGTLLTPAFTVTDGTALKGSDWELVGYSDNTNVGTATVSIRATDDGNYSGTASKTFAIGKLQITKPTEDTRKFVYNEAEQTYTVAENSRYTVSGNTRTVAGLQTVTVALKDKANTVWVDGTIEDVSFPFTIEKAEPELSVSAVPAKTYGDEGFTLEVTKHGESTPTFAVDNDKVLTVDADGKITLLTAGMATVTVSMAESDNYNSKSVPVEITVGKKGAKLAISKLAYEVTYGDADFQIGELSAEGESKAVLTNSDESVVTVDENGKVHILKVGEVSITYTMAESDNYTAATPVTVTVKVNPKAVTVTPDGFTKTYGDEDAELTYKTTELVGEDKLELNLSRDKGEDVGKYTITAAQEKGKNANYAITFETGEYEITPKSIKDAVVTLDGTLTANGKEQTQKIKSVVLDEFKLTYEVTDDKVTEPGSYTLTVTGTKNFCDEVKVPYAVLPAAGNDLTVVGQLHVEVRQDGVAPASTMNTNKSTVAAMVATTEELSKVAGGDQLDIWLEVKDANSTISAESKALIAAVDKNQKIGTYLDIDLFKMLSSVGVKEQLHETAKPISISVAVPGGLTNIPADTTHSFYILRVHDGKAQILDATYDKDSKTLTFETDRFSDYAITYKDTKTPGKSGVSPKTGDESNIMLWGMTLVFSTMGLAAVTIASKKKRYVGKYVPKH